MKIRHLQAGSAYQVPFGDLRELFQDSEEIHTRIDWRAGC